MKNGQAPVGTDKELKRSAGNHVEKRASRKARKERKHPAPKWAWRIMPILLLTGILGYAGLVGLVYYAENHVPMYGEYDSIIVLGAQVKADGSPSIHLRLRLDKAAEMYWANPCPMVLCGGQGGDEPEPEGDVMRALLIADGLPEAHLYAETTSVDTKENISHAWEILRELGCERPLLVTSDYHLPRALAIAEDVGLEPQGAGSLAENRINHWLKYHMREALSWVKYWGIKHVGLPL